jgi:nucleoside-diphosphate kinase
MGEIIKRFEQRGLKIVGLKMVYPNNEFAKKHYPVTEEWYCKVGKNTLDDCKKYEIDAKENIGTKNPTEIGKKVHQWNVDLLTSGPVVAMVLEGVHAIESARKMAGDTVPNLAQIGTIRGDFTGVSAISSNVKGRAIYNLVHTSKNKEEAELEINLWFDKKELHDYKIPHQEHFF